MRYFIILIVFIHLIWYWNHIKKEYKVIVDLWLAGILTGQIFYFINYFFAKDDLNVGAVGGAVNDIANNVDFAFDVVILGYVFFWIGKSLYDKSSKKTRIFFLRNNFESLVKDPVRRRVFVSFFIPLIIYIVILSVANGGLRNDIRLVVGIVSSLRIVYNICQVIVPFIMLLYGTMYMEFKRKKYLFLFLLFFVLSLFLSMRGVSFSTIVTLFIYNIINKGLKISKIKIVFAVFGIIVSVMAMGILRNGGEFSLLAVFFGIAYGNTFSDLRDFSWILSGWDGNLLFGKTYLAGLMSFIPSSLSDFRETWSFGRVSLKIAGIYDEDVAHGGLRGTIYCESFINFGYIGLIAVSTFLGYISAAINYWGMRYIRLRQYTKVFAISYSVVIFNWLSVSSSTFSIYVLLIPLILLNILVPKTKCKKTFGGDNL